MVAVEMVPGDCEWEPDGESVRCIHCGTVRPSARSRNCGVRSVPWTPPVYTPEAAPVRYSQSIPDTAADCIHRGNEKDTAKCKPCQNGGASTTKVYHCRKLDIDVSPGLVMLDGQRLHRCWLDCDFYTPAQTPETAHATETANEGDRQRPADQPERRDGSRDRREDVSLRGAGPAGETAAGSQHPGDGETAGTKTTAV